MAQPRSKAPSAAVLMQAGLIPQDILDQYTAPDADYTNTQIGLQKTRDHNLMDRGFVLGPNDPQGHPTFQMDQLNPFGQYQSNLRDLANNLASSRFDALARGLKSRTGLGAAKERLFRAASDQVGSGILNSAQGDVNDYFGGLGAANSTRNTAKNTAYSAAAQYWAEHAPDDPTTPAPPTAPPGGPPSSAPTVDPNTVAPTGPQQVYTPGYVGPHDELPNYVTPGQMAVAPPTGGFNPNNMYDPAANRVLKKGGVL